VRREFVKTLVEEAASDERIVLLTGDLGFGALEPFSEQFPDRFFNVGVAEQNMVGLATGLAEAGFTPFVYSIATFMSMRPYEFIRNGAVLHEFPVRVVGMGGGLDYGPNGISHFALEDVALMRAQPDMRVIVPADAAQTRAAVRTARTTEGPFYLRLEKDGTPVPDLDGRFAIGRAQTLVNGGDLAIVAMGGVTREAVRAAELLAAAGIDASVVVVSSFNPAPEDDLANVLRNVPLVLTVEAHYLNGGLGSLVCEIVAERGLDCRVVRRAIARVPRGETGSRDALFEVHGLTAERIAHAAREEIEVPGRR
jgi:transketolase